MCAPVYAMVCVCVGGGYGLRVFACVCVCVRERERGRERGSLYASTLGLAYYTHLARHSHSAVAYYPCTKD